MTLSTWILNGSIGLHDCLQRFVVSSLTVVMCIPTLNHAFTTYSFLENTNATFHFNHELSNEFCQYNCEIFSLNSNHPFYVNGDVDQTSLRPEQRGRFLVRIAKAGTNVTVSVYIREIIKIDIGVYVVTIRETIADKFEDSIYDADIKVTRVPPKAECVVHLTEYGNEAREIHCKARLEGEIKGKVNCFQDSEEALALYQTTNSNDELFSVCSWCGLHLRSIVVFLKTTLNIILLRGTQTRAIILFMDFLKKK